MTSFLKMISEANIAKIIEDVLRDLQQDPEAMKLMKMMREEEAMKLKAKLSEDEAMQEEVRKLKAKLRESERTHDKEAIMESIQAMEEFQERFGKGAYNAVLKMMNEEEKEEVPPISPKDFGKVLHAFMFAVRETIDEHAEKMKRDIQAVADMFREDWREGVIDLGFASEDE